MGHLPSSTRIPKEAVLLGIVEEYKGLADMVPCGLCGTMHGKGVVVCYQVAGDQQQGIIGHICGKKNFGSGFIEVERAWRQTKKSVELRAMIDRFEARVSRIEPEVQAIKYLTRRIARVSYVIEGVAARVAREVLHAIDGGSGFIVQGGKPIHAVKGRTFWRGFEGARKANSILRDILMVRKALNAPVFQRKKVEEALNETLYLDQRWVELQGIIEDAQIALEPTHLHQLLGAVNKLRAASPELWDVEEELLWKDEKWLLPVRVSKGWFEQIEIGGFGWEPVANLKDGLSLA